ncbi:MAG: hypothetical protein ACREOQ_01260 [Gemmatimonadales bacterium]
MLQLPSPSLDYFRTTHGRPIAIVVHVGGVAVPAPIEGLTLARLPDSWVLPGAGAAYLLFRWP